MISNKYTVTIGGPLVDKLQAALGECWVESSVNLPAAFSIRFRGNPDLLMKNYSNVFLIGAPVTVRAFAAGQSDSTLLVSGAVTALEVEYADKVPTVVVRGLDHAFKMLRRRRVLAWKDQTASEIVAKLAGMDGVPLGDIEPTKPSYPLLTQPNISDWEFANRLADMSDMTIDFDDEGSLRFAPAKPASDAVILDDPSKDFRVISVNSNVLRLRAGVTASDQVSTVLSLGWDQQKKLPLTGSASGLHSSSYDIPSSPEEVIETFGPSLLTETGTPYGSEQEVLQAATSLAADAASAFAEVEVELIGTPQMKPGIVVKLTDAGEKFDGKYTVTTTRHMFDDANNYHTWVSVTGRQVRTLYGLAAGGLGERTRIPGVVNAIVTDIKDPDKQGRVMVKFPWFDDGYVTRWARTLQYGGVGGGGVISPEVNDEVLVAFDRGVMDFPYVLGGLYSSVDRPNDHGEDVPLLSEDGHLNRRSLESRTGHRLELLDAATTKGVRLRSGDDKLTVFLDQTETTITISSTGKVDISGGGQVSVTGASVNVKGASITLDGDVSVTGVLNVAGDTTFEGWVSMLGGASMVGGVVVEGGFTSDGVPYPPVG